MHNRSSGRARLALLIVLGIQAVAMGAAAERELRVDCSKVIGQIRPLHGGNGGPLNDGELTDLSAQMRELGIPFLRLHDCHWPNPDVVDIHAIFPNLEADPALPRSYDFRRTDDYIAATLGTGAKIVYRLGESIEHTKKKYRVNPPADPDRWAQICLGIVRHYNEGWGDGSRHNITYWEIWNEPENRPAMWTGTDEQFLRLYEATAKAIKTKFPALKVGGPSLGYTGKIADGRFKPSEFMVKFLEHCRKTGAPVDFFSWHLYTNNPAECLIRARGIRDALDKHGFTKTELHFNEWNYLPDNQWTGMGKEGQGVIRERFYERIGSAEGAAFAACVLMNLQDSPVDVANYYTADNGGFGLFTRNAAPRKAFYAFKAFRTLLDTPRQLEASGGEPGRLNLISGTNADKSVVQVMVSNLNSPERKFTIKLNSLPWKGPARCVRFIVDAQRDLAKVREEKLAGGAIAQIELELPAPSLCVLRIIPEDPANGR